MATKPTKRRFVNKKGHSAKPLIAASTVFAGFGTYGARPRPWNYWAGIRQFTSWVYAAAMVNAQGMANVPLRLYVRRNKSTKASYEYSASKSFELSHTEYCQWLADAVAGKAFMWQTRPVADSVKKYLLGHYEYKPCKAAIQKAITFGGEVEEVTEPHPALQVLQTVNKFCNGYEMAILFAVDAQLTGNHYEYLVSGIDGLPLEYWRVPPQWTAVVPDPTVYVKGYTYGFTPNQQYFDFDEIDHYKMPNPDDIYYGKGWLEAAWSAVSLHNSRREEDQSTADNMSRPDWLLSLKNVTEKQALDRVQVLVEQKLRGTDKRGNFMTVGGDVSATPLNWEIPEKGTPIKIVEEIAAVSGVPVAMLLSNDPTKATAQTAWLGWMRNTVAPYCRLREEKLNERHLARYSDAEDMFLAHDPASFEDREAETKRLTGLVSGGILTPNEARQELGFAPHKDGNDLTPPSGAGTTATAGDQMPRQNNRRRNED